MLSSIDKAYLTLIKLLIYAFLIPPGNANMERGFSMLRLFVTKQRNRVFPTNIEPLMFLVLLDPNEFNHKNKTWNMFVDKNGQKGASY